MSFHWPTVLVFLGAVLAAVGVFLESTELRRLNQELANKSAEISELNQKIASFVTGGRSFCYVVMRYDGGDPDHLYLSLMHTGDFAVFDVTVQLVDVDQRLALASSRPGHDVEAMMTAMEAIPIGTVPPGEIENIFRKLNVAGRDSRRFSVMIQARNGWVEQKLALRKVGQEWKSAISAIPKFSSGEETGKVEIIDKAFPRTSSGEVAW
jgi:hypothetical protein